MSVRIMSLVYSIRVGDLKWVSEKPRGKKGHQKTDFTAKASSAKSILLAYADHSNDDGISTYPGYTLLEEKTELSRQGIADTINALVQNGFMTPDGISARGTNQYAINLSLLIEMKEKKEKVEKQAESSHLTTPSQATLLPRVKPLDLNHPLTTNKPLNTTTGEISEKIDTSHFFKVWDKSKMPLYTPIQAEEILDEYAILPHDWIDYAFKEAADANVRTWRYVRAILRSCIDNSGIPERPKKEQANATKKTRTSDQSGPPVLDAATQAAADRINARRAARQAQAA